jgi:hypothetical protein
MHGDRSSPCPRAKPVAHDVTVELERRDRSALVGWPGSPRNQRPVGYADRGEFEHRSEVNRETSPARMVSSGRVDEQDVDRRAESSNGAFEQGAFAQSQQTRLVRRTRRS